jgi:hypothetical protein
MHGALLVASLIVAYGPSRLDPWSLGHSRVVQVTFAPAHAAWPEPVATPDPERSPTATATRPERIAAEPADVTETMLRQRLQAVAAESKLRSDGENLDGLDRATQRLGKVSSPASIDALAGAMHTMLGTKPRTDAPPAGAPRSSFDFDTAQFRDVKRYSLPDGRWRYVAVLVDATGNTMEVEMDGEDGQRTYAVMERVKANPLLEQVYRQIAMPLFDQMLGGIRKAAGPQPK